MWVNKNFYNFARLIIKYNDYLNIKNELDEDFMYKLAYFSVNNKGIVEFIENDYDYEYYILSDYFKTLVKKGLVIKQEILNNNKNLETVNIDYNNLFIRLFNNIIIDEKYDFFLKEEYYLKNEKIKAYTDKIKNSIILEKYEECADMKKKIKYLNKFI